MITLVLVNGERLASNGGLIDLDEGIIGNNSAIRGDDGTLRGVKSACRPPVFRARLSYLLDLKNIARNNF